MREMRLIDFFFYNSEIHEYQREKFYISDNDKFFDSNIFKEFRFKFENLIHESYNEDNEEFEYFSLLEKIHNMKRFYHLIHNMNLLDDYYYKIIISIIDDSIKIINSSEYFDL